MWDSGLRTPPPNVLTRARQIVARHIHQSELVPLAQLAAEIDVNVHTLRAAARAGHLRAVFSTRSVYGRPIVFATREEATRPHRHLTVAALRSRCRGRRDHDGPDQLITMRGIRGLLTERIAGGNPLPSVPPDYDRQLRALRVRHDFSQSTLAKRIGAANKAVVYRWESRKRRPSPVFWQRLQCLNTELMLGSSRSADTTVSGPFSGTLDARARSSGGQSTSLLSLGPLVRVQPGAPSRHGPFWARR